MTLYIRDPSSDNVTVRSPVYGDQALLNAIELIYPNRSERDLDSILWAVCSPFYLDPGHAGEKGSTYRRDKVRIGLAGIGLY